MLDPYNIHYGFEFLGVVPLRNSFKYPFFNGITGALSVADAVSPRMGFVFDTYHWYTGHDCDMGDLYYAAEHVDRLVNFHVNDGIAGVPREKQEDMERAMPMTTGVIDSKAAYDLFKSRGYEGLILCEPMTLWKNEMKDKTIEEVVKAALRGAAKYLVAYNGSIVATFAHEDDALLFESELADLDVAHGATNVTCEVRSRGGRRVGGYLLAGGKIVTFVEADRGAQRSC